jgi:DNA-binding transcriptional MerR regulator
VSGGGLNIAAVARRTGVGEHTLRKWEQRYGVLQPTRADGGQGRYSEDDLGRVQWLAARLAEGYRIAEAAATPETMVGGAAASEALAKRIGARYVGEEIADAVPALRVAAT